MENERMNGKETRSQHLITAAEYRITLHHNNTNIIFEKLSKWRAKLSRNYYAETHRFLAVIY